MRRRRLRVALLIVVAAAFAGIAYQTARNIALRQVKSVAALGEKLKAEVAQQMRDFKRVKVKQGKTVWEIEAQEAQYLQDQSQVVVRGPKVTVHLDENGRTAQIAGTEGRITLDGGDVKHVELRGAVTVRLDDAVLTTDVATYDQERDVVSAPGDVVLVTRSMEVRGHGMEVEVKPQLVRLLADVRTTVRGSDAAS